MFTNIPVCFSGQSYSIHLAESLEIILADIAKKISATSYMIISDENVAPRYFPIVCQYFPTAHWITIPAGEKSKTLEMTTQLYSDCWKAQLDRKSIILALGGGVVGDIAGFVAGTYMRGIQFAQIPTTLLAMVDSSIGGKVGVDLPNGKNLVGCFKHPCGVWIASQTLETLPDREWRCGMAEVIKHGLLGNPNLLTITTRNEFTLQQIKEAIQVKLNIVQEDPEEKNIRAYLNLGHTFAHAIEQSLNYTIKHGEAVALGLIAATRLSQKLGLCSNSIVEKVWNLIQTWELPTTIPYLHIENCYSSMAGDKKNCGGKIRFILLKGIASPLIVNDLPPTLIKEILESLRH